MNVRRVGTGIVALLLLSSCRSSPAPDPTPPTAWTWLTPKPQGATLHDVWAASPRSYYAVGDAGAIVHVTPDAMTLMTPPRRVDLIGVWGTSDANVYAVGDEATLLHFDGTAWTVVPVPGTSTEAFLSIWGTPDGRLWIGGFEFVLHFDGARWRVEPVGTITSVHAFWTAPTGEMFAAGSRGSLLRRDGASWRLVASFGDGVDFTSLWGSSATDLYVGGTEGSGSPCSGFFHYDGVGLTWIHPGDADPNIFAMWGSTPPAVFAAGESGSLWQFDGTRWQATPVDSGVDLLGVFGTSATDAYAVGLSGVIYRWDGISWEWARSAEVQDGISLWGPGPANLYLGARDPASSEVLFHWDGATLTSVPLPGAALPTQSLHLWGFSGDDILAVGGWDDAMGTAPSWGTVYRFDGVAWSIWEDGFGDSLTAVWGSSASRVFLGGTHGAIFTWDGRAWTPMVSPTTKPIASIHGTGPDDVYAAAGGTLLHFDGTEWTVVEIPIPAEGRLSFVHAFSPSDVWTGGVGADLWHFDGTRWSEIPPVDGESDWYPVGIGGISGTDFYISGRLAHLYHFDGTRFSTVETISSTDLAALVGFEGGQLFAAGYGGTFVRYQR